MAITINHRNGTYGAWGYYGGQEMNQPTHDALLTTYLLAGAGTPRVMQGGLSGGAVAASAATHNGLGVVDLSVSSMSRSRMFDVVEAGMECGLILFARGFVDSMTKHLHGVMADGKWMHPSARDQITNRRYGYKYGGAGLAGAPGARWWGPARKPLVTWANSKHNVANQTRPKISLAAVVWGITNAANPGKLGDGDNDGQQLQKLLQRQGLYVGQPVDGVLGPKTREAYTAWQQRTFGVPAGHEWADGVPARDSLTRLGADVTL